MDLIGPTQTKILGGKKYILIIVDNFSRFTWIILLREQYETFVLFLDYKLKMNSLSLKCVVTIVKNLQILNFLLFVMNRVFTKNFLHLLLHKKNRVHERKIKIIQEMAQTMLNNKTMVLYFLGDAVNPASHIQNIVVLRSSTNQTPYEL